MKKPPVLDVTEFDPELMQANAADAASLLKNLANESRLQILCTLMAGEMSVGQFNKRIPLSQSALSQHLQRLRKDGLLATRRESQTIYYSLGKSDALKIIAVLHEVFCETPGQ